MNEVAEYFGKIRVKNEAEQIKSNNFIMCNIRKKITI
jgi:hypothetical protein